MDILSMIDLVIGTAKHGKLHRFTVMNVPGIGEESTPLHGLPGHRIQ